MKNSAKRRIREFVEFIASDLLQAKGPFDLRENWPGVLCFQDKTTFYVSTTPNRTLKMGATPRTKYDTVKEYEKAGFFGPRHDI